MYMNAAEVIQLIIAAIALAGLFYQIGKDSAKKK